MLIDFDYGYWAEPGTGFDYSGVNTFLLGWLVEKVTGMPFQDALTREIWRQIGAEADATFFAGRYGVPAHHRGFDGRAARPRALWPAVHPELRRGLRSRRSSRIATSIVILHGGRPELLANARFEPAPEDVRHNVYQWDLVFDNDDFYKGGWAGQGLLINPIRDYVAVYTGYFKDDEHSEVPTPARPARGARGRVRG